MLCSSASSFTAVSQRAIPKFRAGRKARGPFTDLQDSVEQREFGRGRKSKKPSPVTKTVTRSPCLDGAAGKSAGKVSARGGDDPGKQAPGAGSGWPGKAPGACPELAEPFRPGRARGEALLCSEQRLSSPVLLSHPTPRSQPGTSHPVGSMLALSPAKTQRQKQRILTVLLAWFPPAPHPEGAAHPPAPKLPVSRCTERMTRILFGRSSAQARVCAQRLGTEAPAHARTAAQHQSQSKVGWITS